MTKKSPLELRSRHIQLYAEDVKFLEGFGRAQHLSLSELVRAIVHAKVGEIKVRLRREGTQNAAE